MVGGDKNKQTEVPSIPVLRCPHKDNGRAAGAKKQPSAQNFHANHQPHRPQQPQKRSPTYSFLRFCLKRRQATIVSTQQSAQRHSIATTQATSTNKLKQAKRTLTESAAISMVAGRHFDCRFVFDGFAKNERMEYSALCASHVG